MISSFQDLQLLSWKKNALVGFFAALFFLAGSALIQYHFAPSEDFAKRLLWNIQYGQYSKDQEQVVDFFDDEKDIEKIYENQRQFQSNERLKQINENYKNK